jgi:hypothetical protein
MTRKVYRTAQGKMVDLGALQLQNESVRAVGNMRVNARGDLIDSHNDSIDSRNQQVSKQYRRQTNNVSDTSVARKKDQSTKVAGFPENKSTPAASPAASPMTHPTAAPAETEASGLAAAIARARQIKQEPIRTAQDIAQNTEGVSKI